MSENSKFYFRAMIEGDPVSKANDNNMGRGRFFRSTKVTKWEDAAVQEMAKKKTEGSYTGDVKVLIVLHLAPRSYWRFDVDNGAKAPLDALQKACVIKNDNQVVELTVKKVRTREPSIFIEVTNA